MSKPTPAHLTHPLDQVHIVIDKQAKALQHGSCSCDCGNCPCQGDSELRNKRMQEAKAKAKQDKNDAH